MKILYFLFAFSIFNFTSFGQKNCRVDTAGSFKTTYEAIKSHSLVSNNFRLEALSIIPIKLHVEISKDHGTISINDFYTELIKVNEEFSSTNVKFVICGEVDYFTEDPTSKEENSPTALDFYIQSDTEGWCGYASLGPTHNGTVTINNSCVTVGTISHEIGHYFNLEHTFETRFGLEFVNGTNCKTTGDLLCDTPADPEDIFIDMNCNYAGNMKDPNGDAYHPDTKNFMSYFGNCKDRFSLEQVQRMKQYLDVYFLATVIPCPPALDLIAYPKNEGVFVKGNTHTRTMYIRNVSEVDMASRSFSFKVQTKDASGKVTILADVPVTKALKANSIDSVIYTFTVQNTHTEGLQSLEIILDSKNQISESSENNNVFQKVINVVSNALAYADLELKMISTANAAYAGQGFTFSYSVQNVGALDDKNGFMIEYIVSKDSVFSDDDQVVSTFGTGGHPVGYKSIRIDEGVLLPSKVGEKLYVIILLNRYNYFPEISYENNIKIIPVTIYPSRVAKLPDISAVNTEFAWDQTNPIKVEKYYTLATFFQNIGDTLLKNKTVSLYLSKDQVFDNADMFLSKEYSGLWLDLEVTRDDYVGFKIPGSVTSGNYYIIAIADEENMIIEKDEKNNTMAFPVNVIGGNAAKYLLSNPSLANTNFVKGRNWNITVDVKNVGNAAVIEKSFIFYHLQAEKYRYFEPFRYSFSSFVMDNNGPALGPKASVKYTYQGIVPSDIPEGAYYFGFCMDYKAMDGVSADTSIYFEIPVNVTSVPTALGENTDEHLISDIIYPNPASDVVALSEMAERVQLLTLEGKPVLDLKNVKTFSVKELENGIYIVRAQNNKKVIIHKLTKTE